MKKENRGRKKIPSDEKKIPITVFCKKEKIDSIGGMESAKELIIETLNKIYETGK